VQSDPPARVSIFTSGWNWSLMIGLVQSARSQGNTFRGVWLC